MKRDMDLLRKILIAVSILDDPKDEINLRSGELDLTNELIMFHLHLLAEKKLINLEKIRPFIFRKTLTDKGADVLECIEDEEGWEKLQDAIIYKGKPVTTDTMIQMVNHVLRIDFGETRSTPKSTAARGRRNNG